MYHYSDVIMDAMASRITSLTIIYIAVYSGANQRKYQSFASLAFVRGIHRWPVNSPHKGRKIFPFDDVIMMTPHDTNLNHHDYFMTVTFLAANRHQLSTVFSTLVLYVITWANVRLAISHNKTNTFRPTWTPYVMVLARIPQCINLLSQIKYQAQIL